MIIQPAMHNMVGSVLMVCGLGFALGCSTSTPQLAEETPPEVTIEDSSVRECNHGDTEDCTCGSDPGARICIDGDFQDCECDTGADDPKDDGNDLFGDCLPGRYEGNFEGWAGFLIESTPVTGLDLSGIPALVLNLEQPGGSSEFLEVGDGFMKGNANGTFPFEARIRGRLNCGELTFEGEIAGSVQLFVDGFDNPFTGTMTSKYDPAKHAFTEGKWKVTGTSGDAGVDFGLTGSGKWSAEQRGAADAGP